MRNAPISLAGNTASLPPAVAAKPKAAPVEAPALIVFGYDEAGKAHASCFGEEDSDLARKAAAMMGYQALQVTSGDVSVLAAQLPQGRVFASGRAFVPFVKVATFEALAAAAGVTLSGPNERSKTAERTINDAEGDQPSPDHNMPLDWQQIKERSLVLASVGEADGWYEAIVLEVKPNSLFVVKWRDWPDEPVLVRRREHLGLLHPDYKAAS